MMIRYETCFEKNEFINIYIDDVLWKSVHSLVFKKISQKMIFNSVEAFEEYFYDTEKQTIKALLYQKLGRKSYFSFELYEWMKGLNVSFHIIDELLSDCKRYGYINDEEYVKNLVRIEISNKRGSEWIKKKLLFKKIPAYLIEIGLEESLGAEDLREQVLNLLNTKFKGKNLKDFKIRSKTIASIARRGYEFSLINEVLNSEF